MEDSRHESQEVCLLHPGNEICSLSLDSQFEFRRDRIGINLFDQLKKCFYMIAGILGNSNSTYLKGISARIFSRFKHKFRFPGLQPMNLHRNVINNYLKVFPQRFIIAEKSDGVRYFLIHFLNGTVYFLGTNLTCFQVKLNLNLRRKKPKKENEWKICHIFDGELITEKDINKEEKMKYIVFDALLLNGEIIGAKNYKERLNKLSFFFNSYFIQNQITNPPEGGLPKDIISVNLINYYTFDKINDLIKEIKQTKHNVDGIIINTDDYPYFVGTCAEILKWKPAHYNTVDFYVKKIEKYDIYFLYVYYDSPNDLQAVSTLLFNSKEEEEEFKMNLEKSKTHIIECYFDAAEKDKLEKSNKGKVDFSFIDGVLKEPDKKDKFGWKLHRFRDDRDYPNFIKVYKEIFYTISEQIELEDLIDSNKIPDTISRRNPSDFCISEIISKECNKVSLLAS